MALTYTEIEEQKNTRICLFFAVVVLFYFVIAVILGNAAKAFLILNIEKGFKGSIFLTVGQLAKVVLFAFITAIIHTLYSMHNAPSFIKRTLNTENVDPSDTYHGRFKTIVDEVNVATGNKYKIIPVVVPTVAMNAFAISDRKRNAVIGITEGLLSKLTRQQLQAVVAHEVGHIVSGDSFQTTLGCALFGIYAAMLSGIRRILGSGGGRVRVSGKGSGGIILFLAAIYFVLMIMQFFYSIIRLVMSRDREFRADAIAVKITRDPISLSEALYAISRGWRGLGYIDRNLESLFIINPAVEPIDEKEGLLANLMSTHPPIRKRMALLAQMAHADIKNIQENVLSREKLKDTTRDIPHEKETPRWLVTNDKTEWQGPFSIPQMMVMGRVNPWTWVKELDKDAIKQAKDAPLLKPMFDSRMTGLKLSASSCPKCNQALTEEEYEGASVSKCVFCSGLLVSKDRISRIVIRKEKGFSDRVKKLAELTQKNGLDRVMSKVKESKRSPLKCPKCKGGMIRNFYTMVYFVEVDRCYTCDLTWFDKDELEMIQYLIENRKSGKDKLT
ncbi:MAG: zinc metalloprotease HtpX [Candidatus Omnitrophota bacterium]